MFRRLLLLMLLLVLPHLVNSMELRDPMEPYDYKRTDVGQLESALLPLMEGNAFRLSGIFVEPKGNSAMINNRRVYVGEQVDGAQVVTIDPRAVELELQGEKINLELLPISVKTPAKGLSGGGK